MSVQPRISEHKIGKWGDNPFCWQLGCGRSAAVISKWIRRCECLNRGHAAPSHRNLGYWALYDKSLVEEKGNIKCARLRSLCGEVTDYACQHMAVVQFVVLTKCSNHAIGVTNSNLYVYMHTRYKWIIKYLERKTFTLVMFSQLCSRTTFSCGRTLTHTLIFLPSVPSQSKPRLFRNPPIVILLAFEFNLLCLSLTVCLCTWESTMSIQDQYYIWQLLKVAIYLF